MARPLDPLSLKTLRARLASLDDELDLYPGQLPQPTLMLMLVRILRGWFDGRVEPDAPEAASSAGSAEGRCMCPLGHPGAHVVRAPRNEPTQKE